MNAADVPGDIPPWPATAADGRILAGSTLGDGHEKVETHLVAIDPERGSTALLHRLDGSPRPAAWDHRGEHIVLADGPDLTVIGLSDRALFTLRDIVSSGHHVVGMR